jgi:epsilon-lactone hydrolase
MWLIASLVVRAVARVCARRWRHGPRLPSWSFRFECEVEICRLTWATMGTAPLARLRPFAEQGVPGSKMAGRVACRRDTIAGVPGMWVTPRDGETRGALLYIHGGVFTFGSPEQHFDLLARLALAGQVRVFAPRYRLAPEHPFPAAIEDCVALYRALRQAGTPASAIAVAGDSAGANLALVALLRLRDAGDALPAGALLISPWIDLALSSASMQRADTADFMPLDMLRTHAALYGAGRDLADPELSPIGARLDGLPELLVQVGGAERFLDEATALVERVRRAHGAATLDVVPDMPHEPHVFSDTWQARRAFATAGAFLQRVVQPRASAASARATSTSGAPARNGAT